MRRCKLRVRCCKTERIQSPRLSGSSRKVWTFFPFLHPLALHGAKCGEEAEGGSAHDDSQPAPIHRYEARVAPRPLTTVCFYFVVAPGEHAERRALAVRPWGLPPGDAPASVTGTSLADQWSPPSGHPYANGVHGKWMRSPLPPAIDAQAFAAASHTPAFCVRSPNATPCWLSGRGGSWGDRHGRRRDGR